MLVKKQDFTFSGGLEDDEEAEIKFDLTLQPQKTQTSADYALLIMTADVDQSKHLVKLLTNGKSKAHPGQTDTERQEIQSVDDALEFLDPVSEELTVFKTIIFDGNPDTSVDFKATYKIPYEGVFSTYFLFGQYKTIKLDSENGDGSEG